MTHLYRTPTSFVFCNLIALSEEPTNLFISLFPRNEGFVHIKNLVFADSFMESSSYNEFELQLSQVSSGENTLSCNHAVEEKWRCLQEKISCTSSSTKRWKRSILVVNKAHKQRSYFFVFSCQFLVHTVSGEMYTEHYNVG